MILFLKFLVVFSSCNSQFTNGNNASPHIMIDLQIKYPIDKVHLTCLTIPLKINRDIPFLIGKILVHTATISYSREISEGDKIYIQNSSPICSKKQLPPAQTHPGGDAIHMQKSIRHVERSTQYHCCFFMAQKASFCHLCNSESGLLWAPPLY